MWALWAGWADMNVFLGWLATDAARMLLSRHPGESWDPATFAYALSRWKPKALDSSFRWNDGIEGLRRRRE
jgi:hypothetical protein